MVTRKQILEMLAAGEIDVNRATEMLGEVRGEIREGYDPTPPEPPVPPLPATPPAPPRADRQRGRWLHIHVSDLQTGRNRVKVNVPLGLVQFGFKIGAHFASEVDDHMMKSVMEALRSEEVTGTLVEVEDEDDNERVHIFVD